MMMHDAKQLEVSIRRLFPDLDPDQALSELLLARAQRNLIKYRTMARQFQVKYNQDFEAFRQRILASEPGFEEEQDYFDWEMAVTGIDDMQEEIEHLKRSKH
jgi:hypothetical protein